MRHLIIPDTQIKPGVDISYLEWIGNYIITKQPEKIIAIGDFADMPSLSSYDVGKKSFEGKRYTKDIEAARKGMELLFKPIKEYNSTHKIKYKPEMDLCLGNHENRINKVVENDPKLDGVLSISDLGYAEFGWNVHSFLDVITRDDVAYSHYFTSGVLGKPVTSAQALLTKKHMSCVMGHVQERQIAFGRAADGRNMTAIFAGSCYLHNEDYLGAQGNGYWRGIWMLHEVNKGAFDEMPISLSYLKKKYK